MPDIDPHLDFPAAYRNTPPWDIGRPQAVFTPLLRSGEIKGKVLDVGCGTGENALMVAEHGLPVLGIDIVESAISAASAKASERNLRNAEFRIHSALELPTLSAQFDNVIDSGFFHVLDDRDRLRYIEGLAAVLPPGGRLFLLCFSELQPGTMGPRRITQDEIRASFAGRWRVDSIESARFEIRIAPEGAFAWFAGIMRI